MKMMIHCAHLAISYSIDVSMTHPLPRTRGVRVALYQEYIIGHGVFLCCWSRIEILQRRKGNRGHI